MGGEGLARQHLAITIDDGHEIRHLRLASRSGRATRRRHLQDEVHRHAGRLLFEAAFAVVIEQFGLEGNVGQVAARTRAIPRRLLSSVARRVGTECVSTGSYRWPAYN